MDPDHRTVRASRVHVTVSDEWGRPVRPGLARWLARVAPARTRGSVNVAVVGDGRVRALNRRYRGIDRATDVLSFPAGRPSKAVRRSPSFLGDIVIARGVALRQARAAGHSEPTEVRVLALHGLLHLLGYDHEDKSDNGAMGRLERRLLRKAGLRGGLTTRR